MNEPELLRRLAAGAGIAEAYYDIWGAYHTTSDATRRALLAAMGIATGNLAALEAALGEQESREWRRILAPVQVVPETALPAQVTLRLAATRAQEEFHWQLTEEGGAKHEGTLRPRDLPEMERQEISGEAFVAFALRIAIALAPGYHQLALRQGNQMRARMSLIVAPEYCYTPPALAEGQRLFGPALQLYALRSQRNWGIGDFTDLKHMVEIWAAAGGDIIGCSPLNALFPHNPLHKSPYSPSSRLYLNVWHLDVEAVPDFQECETARKQVRSPEFQARLHALRTADSVDYAGAAAAKLTILERLYHHFREKHLDKGTERAQAFHALQAKEGTPLYLHALFEALQERFHQQDKSVWGWPAWPEVYRDPNSPEVQAFAEANRERVEFFQYLQWQADRQLGALARRCHELGLGAGLYLDLPVSVDPAGAEAWANQSLYALAARVGAPPDEHNPNGQDWGLPPFDPRALRAAAYAPIVALFRHNMRHAAALRIDHVMGLMRLYWVHRDGGFSTGAYVYYPFEDLLGILALESQRNRCLIIGEDLGTVPEEVRTALRRLGVLSYRLLYFEKDEGGDLQAPQSFPSQALVAVSTHDLPTLAGYWRGHDLSTRSELALFPSEAIGQQNVVSRAEERARLLVALERERLLPEGITVDPASCPAMTPELNRAFHGYLARSPASVMVVQLEDILGQVEQVNIPGTSEQYPNWVKKLAIDLEHLATDPRFMALTVMLREARGRPQKRTSDEALIEDRVATAPQIPNATYRLQFNRGFTFNDATALVPYLSELGISHCYASPLLQARPGSLHGYDIIGHHELNPEIGSREDFDRLCATLAAHDMGLILDLVPNHVGVMGSDNQWWLDVLENGPASSFARFFDIDWEPLKEELRGKVLLPLLGDRYGSVLERGELMLHFEAAKGSFYVTYFEHRLPIDPREYPRLLRQRLSAIEIQLGLEAAPLHELQSLITAFEHLPSRHEVQPERMAERHRDKEIHKQRLARLCAGQPEIGRALADAVADYNGRSGTPGSFALLHELLESQAYRVADWHVASDEINYRRFFDINDLAALRMEDPQVFNLTHQFVLELVANGQIQGLRIDHPDGLFDPTRYYESLRRRTAQALGRQAGITTAAPLYVVVEKILAVHEHLPEDWQVEGSTGYDFANLVNGLFVDPAGERPLTRLYHAFIGERLDFDELVYECKQLIMKQALASELNLLAHRLERIANTDWYTRDFTLNQLRRALAEVVACLPVYRTYVSDRQVAPTDRHYVEWAVARAKKKSGDADSRIFDFIRDVLMREAFKDKTPALQEAVTRFAMQVPQLSAPVMAKGWEDTALYRYHRLLSLNEVGGDPRRFCVSLNAFHSANLERVKRWPHAMLATSTHDSKRAEDVRARINAISELSGEWREQVRRWSRLNRSRRGSLNGQRVPSKNDEYAIYQTLLGAWPLGAMDEETYAGFCQRIEGYLIKAAREAKEQTSWRNPNADYEERLLSFARAVLERSEKNLFLEHFLPFQKKVARLGLLNSLSQTLLKLTAPGVPDIYQGNETWDFSLVDPDNRRAVNYVQRRALLHEIRASAAQPERARNVRALVESMEDGRVKLYLTWRTLSLRQEYADLFRDGDYLPLNTAGSKAEHVCAFSRQLGEQAAIVLAPRWYAGLLQTSEALPVGSSIWHDTRVELSEPLAAGRYRNVLTGEMVSVESAALLLGDVLTQFPVALLSYDQMVSP
ncbi:MAG: malto-oligosyltrehalose synthase [Gammaproteobacteria bacterium]